MSVAELQNVTAVPEQPRRRRALVSTRLLRSEVRLIAGRRRNQMGLLVLAAVPVLLAIAVKISAPRPGRGPDFLSSITANGLFVPLAALTVELTLFLPLAIAMLSGDAIAGEANQGTLRYLLTVPVHRTRLLAVKYASLCIGALWGVGLVSLVGALVGIALFGTGPMTTLSGSQIGFWEAAWRLALVTLYLSAGLAGLAAVGLFISTLTEQPMGATVALAIFTILSWIVDSIPQVSWIHPWLIVDQWMAFGDLLRDPPAWGNISQGLLVDLGYAVVFWLAAWARFSSKDITS
ncbi:ABC transporter permease [Intrasporangium oryzae NRRL B-24470]|uniref:ABC transporter permease n=1 Tax=Intrasporangium oryzae NRRL B-24470 TaxID=1386089 RepID=W9G8U6_9MICO|nr:ABC transporter permease [Intrasporangium oryzae]EWT01248.1 ABC transporter permease [Intrasporangium oryzae NRRL B-24470]